MITSFPYIFTYVDLILYFSICSEPVYPTSPIDMFQWLPKEHMCVLVYLVSIIRKYRPEKSDFNNPICNYSPLAGSVSGLKVVCI